MIFEGKILIFKKPSSEFDKFYDIYFSNLPFRKDTELGEFFSYQCYKKCRGTSRISYGVQETFHVRIHIPARLASRRNIRHEERVCEATLRVS